MENSFGAEYLDSVESVRFGAGSKAQCHMDMNTGMTVCSWIIPSPKLL